MKTAIIGIVLALCILGGLYVVLKTPQEVYGTDYKNIAYTIEGERTVLVNGEGDSGVSYFGNDLITDLNSDGRDDVVFLVTQDGEGSGTFFYVVAALNTEEGYVGSDGYFLGDRIAPQTINESTNPRHVDVIVVNYADRLKDEPMSARPSVGKSAYLKLDTAHMQWAIVLPDFEGESAL